MMLEEKEEQWSKEDGIFNDIPQNSLPIVIYVYSIGR